jgi:hypothetical protein
MKYADNLEGKVAKRIARKKANVFLREDFGDLAGYDQVGRALRSLARKGILLRIGYGLYAKAKVSSLSGSIVPMIPLPSLGKEALARLKVKTGPTTADIDYANGQSTQVPTGRRIGVNKRVSRKIGYNGAFINYERIT